jgi:hypothetical protein
MRAPNVTSSGLRRAHIGTYALVALDTQNAGYGAGSGVESRVMARCSVRRVGAGIKASRVLPCSRRTTSGVSCSAQYEYAEADALRLPEVDRRLGHPHPGPSLNARVVGTQCPRVRIVPARSSRANSTIQDCCLRAGSRCSGSRSIRDRRPSARGSAHARARRA